MKKRALGTTAITVVLSLSVFLTACGSTGGTEAATTSSVVKAGDPAYAQTYPDTQTVENPTGTEIYSVDENFAKTQVRNNVMSYVEVYDGEREQLLAAVADLKSATGIDLLVAIAELTSCSIQTPGDGGTYNLNLLMVNATTDEYSKLVTAYKAFADGTIVFESDTSMVMDYSWGALNTCRFSEDLGMIQVSFAFSIKD
jgi:hypothetical protein